MFSTSLGPNDLIQINLNHWREKKKKNTTKITHTAEYQNNLFQDPKHLWACHCWAENFFFTLRCMCTMLLKCSGTGSIG